MIAFLETANEIDNQSTNLTAQHGRHSKSPQSCFKNSPNTPIHFWGLCGRSIAGIRLYARNTGNHGPPPPSHNPITTPENYQEIYLDRSTRVANLLNLETPLQPGDIETITGYTISYGVPTQAGIEAIHLVAKTEGILLDPPTLANRCLP